MGTLHVYPTDEDLGMHAASVTVADDKGDSERWTVKFMVVNAQDPPDKPELFSPVNGTWVKRILFTRDDRWLVRGGSDGLEIAEISGPRRVACSRSGSARRNSNPATPSAAYRSSRNPGSGGNCSTAFANWSAAPSMAR